VIKTSHNLNSVVFKSISNLVISGLNDFHHSVVLNGCSSDTKYSEPFMLHKCLFHSNGLSYHKTVFISPSDHKTFSQIITSSIFFCDQSDIVTFVHATKHDQDGPPQLLVFLLNEASHTSQFSHVVFQFILHCTLWSVLFVVAEQVHVS
jgi:hypothetical protein